MKRRTAKIDVYSMFLADVAQGAIKPGKRLGEATLAQRWDVSRVPVREALMRLEQEGLVERRPKVGTYLRDAAPRELIELYALRAAIECVVVQKATMLASDEELRGLEALGRAVDRIGKQTPTEEIIQREAAFHTELCRLADMELALRLLRMENLIMRTLRHSFLSRRAQRHPSHAEVVRMMRTRDVDKAVAAMQKHFAHVGPQFREVVKRRG